MGIALWIGSAGVAFVVARLIRAGRGVRWLPELLVAVVTAAIFGGVAGTLDFGGWREPDWRAGAFVFAGSLATVGLWRLVKLVRVSS